jgi:hypothetical protein
MLQRYVVPSFRLRHITGGLVESGQEPIGIGMNDVYTCIQGNSLAT